MEETILMDEKEQEKVGVVHSLRIKILLLVNIGIVTTCILLLCCVIPQAQKIVKTNIANYMTDIAALAGEQVQQKVDYFGFTTAMKPGYLEGILGDVKVKGMDSCYAYVVSDDGTMLYHPTADKIGQPVESDAVKALLKKIEQGERPETDLIIYQFRGKNKYASFYVGKALDYIVVVTVDESEALAGINKLVRDGGLVAFGVFILFGVFAVVMARRIIKPVVVTTQEVVTLSKLDFVNTDSSAEKERKDEVGVMRKAIANLRQELVEVVSHINLQSDKLHDAAGVMNRSASETLSAVEQVEKAIVEIADGASSQAHETQTATENIIVMGNMIEETDNAVELLQKNADAMLSAGNTAGDILEQLRNVNQKTKDAIELIAKQTNVTNDSALRIKEAVDMIADIAEETNLLSLNASIEAARAGEQGRGFAVVASQIQKLAEQSNESAQQIAQIIHLLIEESQKSVATMEDVKEVIRQQDDNVEQTAVAFRDVKTGIDKSIAGIASISEKTRQLDQARVKVVDVVQNLTAIAQENAASTQETSASVSEVGAIMSDIAQNANHLNDIADGLHETIANFKVQ